MLTPTKAAWRDLDRVHVHAVAAVRAARRRAPGRPGVNALRTTRYTLVTTDELRTLRKIRDEQPAGSSACEQEPADELELFGVRTRPVAQRLHLHHGSGRRTRDPPERSRRRCRRFRHRHHSRTSRTARSGRPTFYRSWRTRQSTLARTSSSATAAPDPRHRGLSRKPIFYSLGDFIFQLDLLEPVASDLCEQYKMDPASATDAEFNAMWNRLVFGDVWY